MVNFKTVGSWNTLSMCLFAKSLKFNNLCLQEFLAEISKVLPLPVTECFPSVS